VKKFKIMRLVHISGYQPFCRDRSGHNGGVLLYTRSHLTVKMLPCPNNSLEKLPVAINASLLFIDHQGNQVLFLILFVDL